MSQWYYNKKGRALGPISLDEIKGLIRSGELRGHELVYKDGESDWKRAFDWVQLSGEKFQPGRSSLSRLISLPESSNETGWVALIREESLTEKAKTSPEKVAFRQEGPLTSEQIKSKLQSGDIKYSDHLWKSGFDKWQPIYELLEFNEEAVHLKSEQRQELKEVITFEKPIPVQESSEVELAHPVNLEPEEKIATEVPELVKVGVPSKKFKVLGWGLGIAASFVIIGFVALTYWKQKKNAAVEAGTSQVAIEPAEVEDQEASTPMLAQPVESTSTPTTVLARRKTEITKSEKKVEFIDSRDPFRMKLRVIGSFKTGEQFRLKLQAKPGDVWGRVAHQVDKTWNSESDGKSEIPLAALTLSKGRYNYTVYAEGKVWKGMVEVGAWDLAELKLQHKKNSYFIQSERKRLWQVLNMLEQSQRKKSKIAISQLQKWNQWPEVVQIQKNQNTLAFPDAWLEFSKLLAKIQAPRGIATAENLKFSMADIEAIRKKMHLGDFETEN